MEFLGSSTALCSNRFGEASITSRSPTWLAMRSIVERRHLESTNSGIASTRLNYPQLLAKSFLMIGLCVAVVFAWRERDTVIALRQIFGYIVIFSATVYPWYLLWVLPWATITRHRAWLMLSGLIMLCYVSRNFRRCRFFLGFML